MHKNKTWVNQILKPWLLNGDIIIWNSLLHDINRLGFPNEETISIFQKDLEMATNQIYTILSSQKRKIPQIFWFVNLRASRYASFVKNIPTYLAAAMDVFSKNKMVQKYGMKIIDMFYIKDWKRTSSKYGDGVHSSEWLMGKGHVETSVMDMVLQVFLNALCNDVS